MGLGLHIKSQFARLCHGTGADRLLGAVTGGRDMPLVLGYHRVVEEFGAHSTHTVPAMLVSARMLEQHLDWVARRYRFVSLDELGSRLESGTPAGRVAAVTFDDGYRDVYEHALPLLTRKGIPAALFVVSERLGSLELHRHDKLHLLLGRTLARERGRSWSVARLLEEADVSRPLPERFDRGPAEASAVTALLLGRLPRADVDRVLERLEADGPLVGDDLEAMRPMTWEMLAEVQRKGITVGSHSRTHALLPNETAREQVEEAAASREALETRLGVEVRHFAYPAGCFDSGTVEAVKSAGYRFGYASCRHYDRGNPLLTIPRLLLWERSSVDAGGRFSPAVLSCQANRMLPLASRCRAHHGRPPAIAGARLAS